MKKSFIKKKIKEELVAHFLPKLSFNQSNNQTSGFYTYIDISIYIDKVAFYIAKYFDGSRSSKKFNSIHPN